MCPMPRTGAACCPFHANNFRCQRYHDMMRRLCGTQRTLHPLHPVHYTNVSPHQELFHGWFNKVDGRCRIKSQGDCCPSPRCSCVVTVKGKRTETQQVLYRGSKRRQQLATTESNFPWMEHCHSRATTTRARGSSRYGVITVEHLLL